MLKSLLVALINVIFAIKAYSSPNDSSTVASISQKYNKYRNFYIESFDGSKLAAQVLIPKKRYFDGSRPAVIFANSWTLDEREYVVQAHRFANRGYIVLSYATRGFGRSEGLVTAAGPDDIRDVSEVIDWLEAFTPVDVSKIGMSGVSYGGGIALLALAYESRLSTVASLSSWSDLETSLYGGDTLRKVWIDLLLLSGKLAGRMDPGFKNIYEDLKNNRNIENARTWANERSALSLVDNINSRGTPVLIANSYKDNLFPPNQSLDFFEKLNVPKKFFMSRGIHASAETSGIIGLDNKIWDNVHNWFDKWFGLSANLISANFPYILESTQGMDYFQKLPRGNSKKGSIDLETQNRTIEFSSVDGDIEVIEVDGAKDSGASLGIPIISSLLESHTFLEGKKEVFTA